jgi:hypothetical protein
MICAGDTIGRKNKKELKKEDDTIIALRWWNGLKTEERNTILIKLYKRRQKKNV